MPPIDTRATPPDAPATTTRWRDIHVRELVPTPHDASHTPPQSTPSSCELMMPSLHDDSAPGSMTQRPPDTSRTCSLAHTLQSSPA
jgi:hypothetical protein